MAIPKISFGGAILSAAGTAKNWCINEGMWRYLSPFTPLKRKRRVGACAICRPVLRYLPRLETLDGSDRHKSAQIVVRPSECIANLSARKFELPVTKEYR